MDNQKFPLLSQRVWYYKNNEEGMKAMCKIVDDYVTELDKEKIKVLFQNGGSFELAKSVFSEIPEEVITQIYQEILEEKKTII